MERLEDKFQHLDGFIKSYQTFNTIYEEKKNSDVSFDAVFKRLALIEKFILIISQELNSEIVDKLSEKLSKNQNILNQVIENICKESDKKNKSFDPTEFFLGNLSDDSSSDDNSSVSSIDDINSQDSDSIGSREDTEEIKEENKQLNKLIAKSIIELNARRELKDFSIEKIEEENEESESDEDDEEKDEK